MRSNFTIELMAIKIDGLRFWIFSEKRLHGKTIKLKSIVCRQVSLWVNLVFIFIEKFSTQVVSTVFMCKGEDYS